MSLSLEIHGDEEVTNKLRKLGEKDLIEARNRRLKESAIILQGEAKILAPVKNGMLRKSINYKVYSTYAEVFSNLFYAEFVHEGTNPHIIMPKFKKSLHRIDPKNKEDRFAKLVHHPGYKGNPFFTKAVDNKKSYIIERFNSIIDSYLND